MDKAGIAAPLVFLSLATAAIADEARLGCSAGDKACAIAKAREHPARKLATWSATLERPVHERVAIGDQAMVDFLTLDNLGNGYKERPRVASHDPSFLADVSAAIRDMPDAVRRIVAPKLAGVILVEDFGGTGFTDEVADERGRPMGGFVVLDPAVLRRHTANSWITWRENTPFKPAGSHRLVARIADARDNDRRRAIQYILLHEFAHVISIGARLHPSWALPPAAVGAATDYPFFAQSWHVAGGKYASAFDRGFPERKDIVFYFGPRLEAAQMKDAYEGLERTNFATLYSATHPGDDFAEAFANYVHVVMLKRPFEVRISEGGKPVKTYRACWAQERCRAKRALIEELLGGPAPRPSP